MAKEVLTISVSITGEARVRNGKREAVMIAFTGEADCENFKGHVLPGGMDTQTSAGGCVTLSARYMLEGTDADGSPCRVFIENNGMTDDPAAPIRTTPTIITDSPRLRWLEDARLFGTIQPDGPDGVLIHIFAEE